ncbi:MAG: hypothetical protein NTV61_07170 [Candidatus Bathyarchaeota archaeon]|nr:hypothetical protein [Candidatus Bathyarchaeota archaeon]
MDSENIVAKVEVGFYPKEKPGMGQAMKGQLLLTSRRLVYVKYPGGKFMTAKPTDYSDKIDEGLKNEGSFTVAIDDVNEAKADRVWGTPFLRVRYKADGGEAACSFTLMSSMYALGAGNIFGVMKSPYDQLARIIDQVKAEHSAGGSADKKG